MRFTYSPPDENHFYFMEKMMREKLIANGIQATEIGDHGGTTAFAFPDNEGRWFAVTN